jgi:hypothetical protein
MVPTAKTDSLAIHRIRPDPAPRGVGREDGDYVARVFARRSCPHPVEADIAGSESSRSRFFVNTVGTHTGRRYSHRLIDPKPDEPAVQQIVIDEPPVQQIVVELR